MKSASSRVYTDSALSYTEVLQALDAAQLGKINIVSSGKTASAAEAKANLFLLDSGNLEQIEALEGQQGKGNYVSVLIGYGKPKGEARFLQATNQTVAVTDDKVNATATGGLLISLMVALIAVFGLVMMAKIQTPKSFARRDLIKGRINKGGE